MKFAKVYSAQPDISKPFLVDVELDISSSSNYIVKIVGLGDKAVEESKERVISALSNFGLSNDAKIGGDRIIVSLSPADLKKEGPIFDLPIALTYLLASEEIDFNPENKLFAGELSLDGKIKKIKGALTIAKVAKENGFTSLYLPKENAEEASLVEGINIFPVSNLVEITDHLKQENKKEKNFNKIIKPVKNKIDLKTIIKTQKPRTDFSDVIGQELPKRAMLISAAGGHNIALWGPPGTGKTMMARAFSGILPPLSLEQVLEVTEIHSTTGILDDFCITQSPFRDPHHTASYVSIIGGGTYPKPGEVTLAHRGVLFLDEFVEFDKRVLESLREPLEDKFVRISRAKGSVKFPANFILIAALNPPSATIRDNFITPAEERAFKKKLTGPIMDRIDLWAEVDKVDHKTLSEKKKDGETSKELRQKVLRARKIQRERFGQDKLNANMSVKEINKIINLTLSQKELLETAAKKMDFSPRVYHKILKISQTIADLENNGEIKDEHILEALQYRPKDII